MQKAVLSALEAKVNVPAYGGFLAQSGGPGMSALALQRNPGVRCTGTGDAGTLLLRAGTECENDRDNRAGAGLTFRFPR